MSEVPRIGDAFGESLRAAAAELAAINVPRAAADQVIRTLEILERDDGAVGALPVASWFAPPERWMPCEQRAAARLTGHVLDIGVGAGRLALSLQDRGIAVTGLDISSGALEVARARGVRDVVRATVQEHAASGSRYDSFALFGANLGLLESREHAPEFLGAIERMARPGAQIVAGGSNPYVGKDPIERAYQERNRARGRLSGQWRIRLRYRVLATPWFDYLYCSPGELEDLTADTGWRVTDLDDPGDGAYTAVLRRR